MDTPMTAAVKLHTRVLEVLSRAETPMTALDVYDKPEIKELCSDSGKISVLMSDMWRGGKLMRHMCKVPGTHIRYAYTLAPAMRLLMNSVDVTPEAARKRKPVTTVERKVSTSPALTTPYGGSTATIKPQITVTEHQVVIELATIKITIDV